VHLDFIRTRVFTKNVAAVMVVEVDVIIIRAFPSLYQFHLVTPAARRWVKKNVEEQHDKVVKVLEVERKFA
jgi:hypothetical protein